MTILRQRRIKATRHPRREYLPGLDDEDVTSFDPGPTVERFKRHEINVFGRIIPLTKWKRTA